MSNKLYDETSIQNIANAIRSKNGSSDLYTVGQMAQAVLDIPTGDGDGDITWDRELIEKWDFTKSLEGSEGDTWTLAAGATRTDAGIVFDGTNPNVTVDLKSRVPDWTKVGILFECESPNWDGVGAASQISFFGTEGGVIFEMYGGKAFNQCFPRDFYSPDVLQRRIFRNIYVDSQYGFYSFNRFMGGSSSTPNFFAAFNADIRDGSRKFQFGGYNNYGTPPNGFTLKSLAIYRTLDEES